MKHAEARHRSLLLAVSVFTAALVSGAAAPVASAQAPTVGVSGDRFTINGQPTFLLGVSYFDGLYWKASDLDGLAARQFNLIRIWLDWDVRGFYSSTADLTQGQALLDLVRAAGARGMVVDVTILDAGLTFDPADRAKAVTQAVTALQNEPNVIFDVMNEHDHPAGPISHAEVGPLVSAARAANPNAIITVSSTGGHLGDETGANATNIAEELAAGIQLLTPHLPRTADWFSQTGARVSTLRNELAAQGRLIPLYLQEEARRGHSGLDPTRDQFVQAATAARDAGAAGWNFHTDAGFNLNTADFFSSLDPEEVATVDALGPAVFNGSNPTPPPPSSGGGGAPPPGTAGPGETVLIYDALIGSTILAIQDGPGTFVSSGGGWQSSGGKLVYDAGGEIADGYFEAKMRGWTAPADAVDKTHPLAGWETKDSYGHYLEPGSFWNWRIGMGYNPFKVLAADTGINTRVEARVGDNNAVNDGLPHTYRVQWKNGTIDFLFDGNVLQSWTLPRFQVRYFTVGHDDQYAVISNPAPIISEVMIVDRSGTMTPPPPPPPPGSTTAPPPGSTSPPPPATSPTPTSPGGGGGGGTSSPGGGSGGGGGGSTTPAPPPVGPQYTNGGNNLGTYQNLSGAGVGTSGGSGGGGGGGCWAGVGGGGAPSWMPLTLMAGIVCRACARRRLARRP